MGSRKVGMSIVSVLIAIFIVSMTASAFPTGVDLVRAFFINVFMTAVFSGLAWWWISRFEKKQTMNSHEPEAKHTASQTQVFSYQRLFYEDETPYCCYDSGDANSRLLNHHRRTNTCFAV